MPVYRQVTFIPYLSVDVYDPFDKRNLVVKKAKRRIPNRPTPSSKRDPHGILDSCYASSATVSEVHLLNRKQFISLYNTVLVVVFSTSKYYSRK